MYKSINDDLYIQHGTPVGSRLLAEHASLSLSPASIRFMMSALEAEGYVKSPHTSAGRVPTAQGYRWFVNQCLGQLGGQTILGEASLESGVSPAQAIPALVQEAALSLSELTQWAGIVTLPKRERATLRHVEFLPLGDQRVLVILVLNEHDVQNRLLHTEQNYTEAQLQQAARFLNEHFAHRDLREARSDLLRTLQKERSQIDVLMQAVVDVGGQALAPSLAGDFVVTGQDHLLGAHEELNITRLKELFLAFSEKSDMLYLLDQCIKADGVQIFIGEESGYELFQDCSLITAAYHMGDHPVGVLAVIGPTRMAYHQVIASVQLTAQWLSAAIKKNSVL